MSISSWHRDSLRNYASILSTMHTTEPVILAIKDDGSVTDELLERIRTKQTEQERATELLRILMSCTDKTFRNFVSALVDDGQDDIAKLLDANLANGYITKRDEKTVDVRHARSSSVADGDANLELKEAFKQLHPEVVNLNMASVIDTLISKSVLGDDDYCELDSIADRKQKARRLMALLLTTGHPKAFICLRDALALEPAYGWMVEKIDGMRPEPKQLTFGRTSLAQIQQTPTDVARCVHTMNESQRIWGVTTLANELYVLREKPKEAVGVYDTKTYGLLRQLSVPKLKGIADMTSCKQYRCLYISDHVVRCVHRLELSGSITNWPVNDKPAGLSVTSQFNVIVTSDKIRKVFEFTTNGKQLREINLQPDIINPWQAIQLSNGHFVISHGDDDDPAHRICIVDINGRITHSYGGPPGSATVGQLNVPIHMAVDKDESVFVLDHNNHRVLLLSPTLAFMSEIVSRDRLKWYPRRLFLDTDGRRLYVAENQWKGLRCTAGRVSDLELSQV